MLLNNGFIANMLSEDKCSHFLSDEQLLCDRIAKIFCQIAIQGTANIGSCLRFPTACLFAVAVDYEIYEDRRMQKSSAY